MSSIRKLVLPVLIFALVPVMHIRAQQSKQGIYYRYEIWGGSTEEPGERPWSTSYATRQQAEEELEALKRRYARGGLLESSENKPVDPYIRKVPYRNAPPEQQSEPDPESLSPDGKERPTDPSAGDADRELPMNQSEAEKDAIVIRVYKRVDGKWIEQPDRRFETKQAYEKAKDYFLKVKKYPGWTATWNAPGWPTPQSPAALPKPYNPPADVDTSISVKSVKNSEARDTSTDVTEANESAEKPKIAYWIENRAQLRDGRWTSWFPGVVHRIP